MVRRETSRAAYRATVVVLSAAFTVTVGMFLFGAGRHVAQPQPQPAPAAAAPAPPPRAVAPPAIPVPARPQPPPSALADGLEERFQGDAPGASAPLRRMESVFRGALAGAEGVSLRRIECRAHTCRAEVRFATQARDAEFTHRIFADPDTMIDTGRVDVVIPVRTTADDGSVVATLYFVTKDA